jgi:hypothetical protein
MPPDQPLDINDFIEEFYVVAKVANHSQENLVKFDYRPHMNIENVFKKPLFNMLPTSSS